MEMIGVLAEGETASAAQLTTGLRTLNYMVKAYQNRGVLLNSYQRMYLFLEKNKSEYSLGLAAGAHFTVEDPFDNTSTLSTAEAAASTSLGVVSGSGSVNADNILIELDNGELDDTTISAGGGTTTLTIATGLTTAASAGNRVYWYTTKGNRPLRIDLASIVNEPGTSRLDATETPIEVVTRKEYQDLPSKGTEGQVSMLYYDPQRITGNLHIWPQTDNVAKYLKMWVERPIEDFDASTDDADFPQVWFLALATNLALLLCPKYGAPSEVFNQIAGLAGAALFDAESKDTEGYMLIQPDFRGR
jgi:hypothetical protein